MVRFCFFIICLCGIFGDHTLSGLLGLGLLLLERDE